MPITNFNKGPFSKRYKVLKIVKRYCPPKTKVGQNWCQWTGFVLVMGRAVPYFSFSRTTMNFAKESFATA
jgi:hypothetical protein